MLGPCFSDKTKVLYCIEGASNSPKMWANIYTKTRNKSIHTTINDLEVKHMIYLNRNLSLVIILLKRHAKLTQIKCLSGNAFPPISSHDASKCHILT